VSKSAIVMSCPLCGHRGAHPVEYTVPVNDSFSLPTINGLTLPSWIFSPIYRTRCKVCDKCDKQFNTVEMPEIYFDTLIKEYKRLIELENTSIEGRHLIESLNNKLNKISEIVGEREVAVEDRISKRKVISLFGDKES